MKLHPGSARFVEKSGMKLVHSRSEQHVGIALVRAVRVHFDEKPVRASLDADRRSNPQWKASAVRNVSRRIVQRSGLDARQDARSTARPIEAEGPLNHQEPIGWPTTAYMDCDPTIV